MEREDMTDAQRDAALQLYMARVMSLEIMIRALVKTHPDSGRLVDAVRYYEEGLKRSMLGFVHPMVPQLVQSYLDQAGAG